MNDVTVRQLAKLAHNRGNDLLVDAYGDGTMEIKGVTSTPLRFENQDAMNAGFRDLQINDAKDQVVEAAKALCRGDGGSCKAMRDRVEDLLKLEEEHA